MTTTIVLATAAIESAANFLDTIKPGWFKKVDSKRLDISDPWNCIAGQVFAEEAGKADLMSVKSGYDWLLFSWGSKMPPNADYAFFACWEPNQMHALWNAEMNARMACV